MSQLRSVSTNRHWPDREQAYRRRMRDNLLAAAVIAVLLMSGAWLADELAEASQGCYRPDGDCEAWGIPAAAIGFDTMSIVE
jgi:hypothetical protein